MLGLEAGSQPNLPGWFGWWTIARSRVGSTTTAETAAFPMGSDGQCRGHSGTTLTSLSFVSYRVTHCHVMRPLEDSNL